MAAAFGSGGEASGSHGLLHEALLRDGSRELRTVYEGDPGEALADVCYRRTYRRGRLVNDEGRGHDELVAVDAANKLSCGERLGAEQAPPRRGCSWEFVSVSGI